MCVCVSERVCVCESVCNMCVCVSEDRGEPGACQRATVARQVQVHYANRSQHCITH